MTPKTEAKHTAGPWEIEGSGNKGSDLIILDPTRTSGYNVIASCIDDDGLEDVEEAEANARLIAAAPELLEAANGVVNILQAYNRITGKGNKEITALLDVISKAEGK